MVTPGKKVFMPLSLLFGLLFERTQVAWPTLNF